MTPANFSLTRSRVQWLAWMLALALHAAPLLLHERATPHTTAPAVVMTAILPAAMPVEPASPVEPVHQAAPAKAAESMRQPEPAAAQPVLASTAAQTAEPAVQTVQAQPEAPRQQASAVAVAPAERPQIHAPVAPAAPVRRPAIYRAAYLNNPEPAYPPLSRRAGETGKAVLLVRISILGRAESVQVQTSSGYARLDMAAVEAVRQWRFDPAREGEQVVASLAQIPIDFTLE